jgi:hypothetical protein
MCGVFRSGVCISTEKSYRAARGEFFSDTAMQTVKLAGTE